jgi:hypothetical protein
MMDVALHQAPKFHPDVYLVTLTQLLVNPGWSAHIARIILNGTDLKYDFLRRVAARAGLQPMDHLRAISRELAPYQLRITRWSLEQTRDHAVSQGAQKAMVLVPISLDPEMVAAAFDDLCPAIDRLGVPVVDLRDTFIGYENLGGSRSAPGWTFIRTRAHHILFENLYHKILPNPKLTACLMATSGGEGRVDSGSR